MTLCYVLLSKRWPAMKVPCFYDAGVLCVSCIILFLCHLTNLKSYRTRYFYIFISTN